MIDSYFSTTVTVTGSDPLHNVEWMFPDHRITQDVCVKCDLEILEHLRDVIQSVRSCYYSNCVFLIIIIP